MHFFPSSRRGSSRFTAFNMACILWFALPIFMLSLLQGCGGGGDSTSSPSSARLAISTSSLTGGVVSIAYSATLNASGGSGTDYSWSLTSGTLPTGLALATNGAISGTPTAQGTSKFTVSVTDSAGASASGNLSIAIAAAGPLTNYDLTGDTTPVHDPSIIREGSTYYVFSTDASASQGGYIPIRCSSDRIAWTACGNVFNVLPSWVATAVPQATEIWAPDISYFNGAYHLYYAVSTFGSNVSAIGLATNPTLDSTDPSYKWTDQGMILQSTASDDFNAIDPNIFIDTDGSVWLTYGSFWSGIYQQQIDSTTGQIEAESSTYHLAERASSVANDPIEGASLVHEGSYYYLFVSWDYCCESEPVQSNYKIVVGRGTSRNGPFVDESGVDMASGGGMILLQGDGVAWSAPGGQTVYIDSTGGDLIVFHALRLSEGGLDYLFVRTITWENGWPVIGDSATSTSAELSSWWQTEAFKSRRYCSFAMPGLRKEPVLWKLDGRANFRLTVLSSYV
jgi:arabinan endo-1,5-alpha-L-arabinosidase